MKKFLHSHPNLIIGAIYIVFIGILLAFYFWAVNNVFDQLRFALISPPPQSAVGFDLAGAAKLDLRGLLNGAPAPTAVVATPAASTTATSTTQ
jgi:hypothetical protein